MSSGPYRRPFTVLPLVLLLALAALPAGRAEPPQKPAAPSAVADLPPRYQEWLAEVAPLLDERERAAFLGLSQDYQRDAFIREFWRVRDPHPETARNELAEGWKERAQAARDRFGGLDDARTRVLLLLGEPADRSEIRCSEVLLPLEVWRYAEAERVGGNFNLVFVRAYGAKYQAWVPGDGVRPLLVADFRIASLGDRAAIETVVERCPRGDELAASLLRAVDWRELEARLVPDPGGEWVQTFLSRSTDLPADARPLPARLELAFPGRRQSRTIIQGVVTVPRAEAKPERLGEASVYTFLLDGEVVRKGELFDRFRVKFSLPESATAAGGDAIPLVFERSLRPGAYRLVLRVEETTSRRFFREERELEVPDVAPGALAAAPAGGEAPAAPAPAQPNAHPLLVEANAALARAPAGGAAETEQSIRILPPPPGLLTGKARVEAIVAGDGIARVRWDLDGKPILSKSRPPYSVELDLGPDPRLRRLAAVALGPAGEELAVDELRLNAGPHRFSLRLVEPEPGRAYRESLRAQAEVEVPEGEKLDRVEFFLNEDRVATLYQPPFAQPLVLQSGRSLSYVRAVAYLADGNATEDLVLVNAPEYGGAIKVHMVELYTTVVDKRGRPIEGLAREEFEVLEDGAPQTLHRFEKVTDLPIYAGVLLDNSASMVEELGDAVKGALAFFQTVIQPKDRAAVVTFNDAPSLAVRFTNDPQVLSAGLAGVAAEGNTSFYDSLIFTLHYFGGLKGKRALIVLTDGIDEGSRYTFTDALEYARRSGVAIYPVGIGINTSAADARVKLERLGSETGGRHFFIERASDLKRVYSQVEAELRTQYLLAYQSASEGKEDKYRTVEVKVKRPGLEAKTLSGYYP